MTVPVDHRDTLARLLPPVSYGTRGEALLRELAAAAILLDDGLAIAQQLGIELDPRVTYDLLDEFEAAYGLPDLCTDPEVTVADRHAALMARIMQVGGQTPAYYERIAVALGYPDAHVIEYVPATCVSECEVPVAGSDWRNVWAIEASAAERITYLDCMGSCSDPLANWAAIEPLSCVINRLKPAHTLCYFDFGT